MDEKAKSLKRIGFGFATMFGIFWLYSIFVVKNLNINDTFINIIGLVCLYGIGMPLFIIINKGISNSKIENNSISFKTIIHCFLLQFTATMLMSLVVNIVTQISGGKITNQMNMNVLAPFNLFLLLIFNPIIEEFVFRKLVADKLLKYGELFYILTSSFCFAIVHGVSIGIPQILYTFILGLIWSYLYVRTGKLMIPIVLHSLSNLFSGIIIGLLQGISQEVLGMYGMFMMLMAIVGLICFIKNKKKISIDNENKLIKKSVLKDIFTNKGIIIYIALTVTMFVLKNNTTFS